MKIKNQVVEKLSTLITAAFGLVAALAWNSAIQQIFKIYFGETSGVGAMLLYATFVTIIAVVVTVWIGKITEKIKGEESDK